MWEEELTFSSSPADAAAARNESIDSRSNSSTSATCFCESKPQ